ncbi:MAG: class I SAM-dependent methyltransferase [Clostridia bacterium]|nr:class I SAM-dependent methyltransferase [Clostridia bacterium]
MSNLKPEEFRITDQALGIWNLKKGAEVLDIGCGQGETVEYLEKEYGYKARGIDLSKAMIKRGLARNPKLNIQYGDGEFLDGFLSYSFDGVMMENVLSFIGLPDEALHEAYCVLKKGGKLFISDLFIKDPDTELLKAVEIEAQKQQSMPHPEDGCGSEHGEEECGCGEHTEECGEVSDCDDCSDCGGCGEGESESERAEEHRYRAVNFRSNGRFLIPPLLKQLKEIGYTNIAWEDCSVELDDVVAKRMREDTSEGRLCREMLNPNHKYKTGYFMLTAKKPL